LSLVVLGVVVVQAVVVVLVAIVNLQTNL